MNAPGSLRIITSPCQTLAEVAKAPRWHTQFLIICLGSIGATLAIRPFTRQASLLYLESLLPADELERALTYVDHWFFIGLVLAPLFLLAKFGLYAILIRAAGTALGLPGDLHRTFTVVVWSSTAVLFEAACIGLVLWSRGIDAIHSLEDLEVRLGLNLFFPCSNPGVDVFLGRLNPFELWFMGLLAVGIARVYSVSVWRACLVSAPLWIGGVVVQSAIRLIAS